MKPIRCIYCLWRHGNKCYDRDHILIKRSVTRNTIACNKYIVDSVKKRIDKAAKKV